VSYSGFVKVDITEAVAELAQGNLIGLPTETVYGLAADASNEVAVRKIFAAKGRPSTHPLIVHVASPQVAKAWALSFSSEAQLLAQHCWPGPLTLIVKRSTLATDAVTGGQDTVGLRVPSHPLALQVLSEFQGGIAAPSANRFGRVSPTTAAHVREEFQNAFLVLDGGPCTVGVESTIVDVSGSTPRLLRPGGLALERIEEVLGTRVQHPIQGHHVRAPGLLASHYAPRAGVQLVSAESLLEAAQAHLNAGLKVATLSQNRLTVSGTLFHFDAPSDASEFARMLFSTLRQADDVADIILVVPPQKTGLGLAVYDRLQRASTPRQGG
jgi:L-threonylcarbamoyladenylate synthase